jgi:hypothetical protein
MQMQRGRGLTCAPRILWGVFFFSLQLGALCSASASIDVYNLISTVKFIVLYHNLHVKDHF